MAEKGIMILGENDMATFSNSQLEAGYNAESNTWEVIVKYHGDIKKLEAHPGVEVEILSHDYAIITVPVEDMSFLENYSEVEAIEKPRYLSHTR